jgi:hypothetical protein
LLTVDLDEKISSGAATQVRVVQNQEPKHFMEIFKHKFVVFKGDNYDKSKPALFHVGSRNGYAYPIQVNLVSNYKGEVLTLFRDLML